MRKFDGRLAALQRVFAPPAPPPLLFFDDHGQGLSPEQEAAKAKAEKNGQLVVVFRLTGEVGRDAPGIPHEVTNP